MGKPLFIEGGDPFDYVTGYTRDGLPMTRSDLERILGKLGPTGFLALVERYNVPWTQLPLIEIGEIPLSKFKDGLGGVFLPRPSSTSGKNRRVKHHHGADPQNVSTTQDDRTICDRMADNAQAFYNRVKEQYPKARKSWLAQQFNREYGMHTFGSYFAEGPLGFLGAPASFRDNGVLGTRDYEGVSGFPAQFRDTLVPLEDQVHHFGGYFSAGLAGHYGAAKWHRDDDEEAGNFGDVRLGEQSFNLGAYFRRNPNKLDTVGQIIRSVICGGEEVPR
jgi:hypothetical protein